MFILCLFLLHRSIAEDIMLLKTTFIVFLCIIAQSIPIAYSQEQLKWLKNEPITPIPDVLGLELEKVKLGKRLFHDVNLSSSGTISCASCHNLSNAGVDSLPVSIGVSGRLGSMNSPTVFNSSLQFRQFWDGRTATLEEQVSGPLTNFNEMANNWESIIRYLQSDDSYSVLFEKNYGREPSKENVSHAIAEFERSLLTPNGKFDRYLKGDDSAIDAATKRGYQLFKSFGCASCHQGAAVGGNMYEKLGVIIPYFEDINAKESDLGRFNVSGIEESKFEFKVPSLRNVALTAPYFHDGSIKTLEEAIKIMAKHQLGRQISDVDIVDITEFLKSLSGDINAQ